MKIGIGLAAAVVAIAVSGASAQMQRQETTGEISEVIVYRGQALVTRTIKVDLPPGGSEVIVRELPGRILPDSLNALGEPGIVVSSVRYREKIHEVNVSDEVKQIDNQIEELNRQIRHADGNIVQSETLRNRYEPFWQMTWGLATSDPNKGRLEFETVEKMTAYLENKQNQFHKMKQELEDFRVKLQKEAGELQRKKAELTAKTIRSERQAVIFVSQGGAGEIKLSYLVDGASWLPQYNLRAEPIRGVVRVEYNALMHQTSGEDWNNVSVSLSTAVPAMTASPPALESMQIKLVPQALPRPASSAAPEELDKKSNEGAAYRDLTAQFQQVASQRREMAAKGKAAEAELNRAAVSNQMIELRADKDALQTLKVQARKMARTEGVSVSYALPGKMTMPSKSEQQLVGITAFEGKADFIMTGTPVLTDYVYVQADVANDSTVIMLAGPANMYRDGEFVGKGEMELVTIGEKFTVGIGVDSQVRIAREFKDKKIETLWGRKRTEQYDYRIAISNYKNAKVKLRLLERIPYTEDESLEIKDLETKPALSSDAEYLRTEKPNGILRWELELAPNTVEGKATIVTYSYTMRYDSEMQIQPVGPVGVQQAK